MNPEKFARLKPLLLQAADLPVEQRKAFLDEACGDDPELRREAESLLVDGAESSEILQKAGKVPETAVEPDGDAPPIPEEIARYRIIRKIGEGGMGVVYEAEDEKLRRNVALKVLSSNLVANTDQRARFLREARATATVTHSNIVTIYEVDEADGVPFLAMELVAGSTLRSVLDQGPLSIPQALGYASEIAAGLARAHNARIVHRDLKPGNILIDAEGCPKIADFGLAKFLREEDCSLSEAEAPTISEDLTLEGSILGTAAYMSPEQARGEVVDLRSDLFSFGVILFEMITGRVPFRGKTPMDTLAAIINREAPSASALNPRVPAQLERILVRCLEKDPANRYQSTADLVHDLQQAGEVISSRLPSSRVLRSIKRTWPWTAGALVVLSALSLLWYFSPLLITPPRIESIAVLPLENQSGDPNQEYFATGMTEALTHELGRIGALRVISRTSAMRFKGSDQPLPEIAQVLNVDAVLEGSIVRVNNRVGITVRLIDPARDQQIWSESFERNIRDILMLRNEVARTIAREIRVELTPREEERLDWVRNVDPQVYDEYMRGMYSLTNNWSREGADKALEHFNRALAKDADFAPAHAGIVQAYSMTLAWYSPEEVLAKALPAAIRALELDDSLGEVYGALGLIKFLHEDDWIGPEREFRRALERSPNNAWIHRQYTHYLMLSGRTEEGLQHARRALELDPLTPTTNLQLGWAYLIARRYEEALEQHERTLDLLREAPDPRTEWMVHYQMAIDYTFMERYEEALEKCEKTGLFFDKVAIYYLSGRRDEAFKLFRERDTENPSYADPFQTASIHALFGEHDQAFEWLDRANESRHPLMRWIKVWPTFDSLRSDPRYVELLERAGIPID